MSSSCPFRAFLENPGLAASLASSWSAADGAYRELGREELSVPGIQQYLLILHVYRALAGEPRDPHVVRAEALARHLAGCVTEAGLIREPSGFVSDHPANACHVADALGTFCHYAGRNGWSAEAAQAARDALVRIVEKHHVVRLPDGIVGRTQQMRFEMRAYYWAWRVTGDGKYKDACFALWKNGLNAYRRPIAVLGGLLQPSLHPDFTWNYTCSSGTTTEYATNTHTPVYYCTEPQGFVFVYLHGLKDGVFERNAEWDEFCRKYLLGLFRNLSRAGHTASDVDGYGIHRAWYSGCLVESIPVEAAAAGAIGLGATEVSWFRWYVERYTDFIARGERFAESGLLGQCPYGHDITFEKQFPVLIGVRGYAQLARGLYEYGLAGVTAQEPPPMVSYAWWHNWARVSTPVYETSFTGTTSLCRIPMAKHYGDPYLGCIHGGAPLATLMAGDKLMYATSNDPEGLWHVALADVDGNVLRSSGSSFADETAMSVRLSDGRVLTRDQFVSHETPVNEEIAAGSPTVVTWSKNLRTHGVRFFVQNSYAPDAVAMEWGAAFPAGYHIKEAVFVLPIPATLQPEIRMVGGEWEPLGDGRENQGWPVALRWRNGERSVTVALLPGRCDLREYSTRVVALPPEPGRPGGENSFCPYPLLQVRLCAKSHAALDRVELRTRLTLG